MTQALVIGGGPAGLMAAEVLSSAGVKVLVVDQKPSVARKFLMAGKSGLNLTKAEPFDTFMARYGDAAEWLSPMLARFGPDEVQEWAAGLGQDLFTGSTGRVFPRAMKASPLLRAWLARLREAGVTFRTRWRWTGWDGDGAVFETPEGREVVRAGVIVLACGGASWARLGSDGAWAHWMPTAPFEPSNVGLRVDWSEHMARHFGKPLKSVLWRADDLESRGEAILSARGLEGGGIYPLIPVLRKPGAELTVDLVPDVSQDKLAARLDEGPAKGLTKVLRNTLRFPPEKIAFANECLHRYGLGVDGPHLVRALKALPVPHEGPRPIDEAISTAGGIRRSDLTNTLMLADRPGVFVAGEMIDWDAPTGGYLLTACLATGQAAGQGALDYLAASAA